ncbi:oxidoreductase [Hydrogenophaga sp. Root209]|uniref:bi-domain-containing oxidoreductase n=1 Tax=Hydrogenophaga sp. Root209 TaxID=1736490 RepID=UPI0006F62A27|nr:bi-domain-containing oxidoreductase [Hydrogenophaga sp. Root209]KRC10422.1 oxidoreductase [Hydrogenophaga sp. Root209]
MKQVLVSGGSVRLETVPAPLVEAGTVLIRMDHSCISIGTEMSGVKSSGVPLWKRAMRQPQHVKKVVDMLMTDGLAQTRRLVQERLAVESPTGYSGAGIVLEVGEGVDEFAPGDRVACAGAQCAFHAEVVRVPKNLVVSVPDAVGFDAASSVALGAIAMQGVRRASPTLGETFVVIGLGILGQLTVQMLRANGCRVIGVDLDRSRIALAEKHGMSWGVHPDDADDVAQVARITGGTGADGVIITAASPSDAIVSAAFRMCRKKARVVLVGDVGLDLQRADFYAKELDFLISSSYGPGRYDAQYEEGGLDYPLAYVRWTEGRNMAEYLRLIGDGTLEVKSMIAAVHPIDNVDEAYRSLQSGTAKPLMVLLSYPRSNEAMPRRMPLTPQRPTNTKSGAIRIALIGAGGFAKGMHLPNLQELKEEFILRAVVSRTGHNAATTGKRFLAEYCTTDHQEVLKDPDIDAVIIATRHDTHATLALDALRAGKHVLLEKPMALDETELRAIEAFYQEGSGPKPVLLTGFNRRFSPYAQRIASLVQKRSNPMLINYRMNAGYIPLDHWVHGPEGGGRNRGEACHIYDLFTFLTGSQVKSVHATALTPTTDYYSATDNFTATIGFDDGSVASLSYTALGNTDFPKESMEVFVDGMVISLNDYRALTVTGGISKPFETRASQKGQKEELQAFAAAIHGKAEWPIPLWQQVQATRISFQINELLQSMSNRH